MISSIFGKTKPINFIIVLSLLFVFYWVAHFLLFENVYKPSQLLFQTAILAVLLFSIFALNFVIKRNKITGTNSFAILFYTLLIVLFPEVLTDSNAVFCSFFLLLSIRRLLSIKSLKNIKLKAFDFTLWTTVASLFYDWALLYLVLVFAAIYLYEPKNIRNWLVPIVGVFTVFMITTAILILTNNLDFLADHYVFSMNFNTDYFFNLGNSTKLIVYIIVVSIAGILAFVRLGKSGVGKISTMRLITLSYFIGLVLTAFKSSPDIFPVMVTFFPAVIFITNYIESIKRHNIKEIVLIASILIPFTLLVSGFILE